MCHPLQGRHKTCFFKEQNEDEFFVYGLIFSKDGCQIGSLVFTESHYFLFIFSAIYTSSKMMVGCYCCCQEHNTLEWEKCCLFLKKPTWRRCKLWPKTNFDSDLWNRNCCFPSGFFQFAIIIQSKQKNKCWKTCSSLSLLPRAMTERISLLCHRV